MSHELEGQHIVVSGAASGIGRSAVVALLAAGARVSALDIDEERMLSLEPQGDRLRAYRCDVTDAATIDAVLKRAGEESGPVIGLVHAAGCLNAGSLMDSALSPTAFEQMMRVNVQGSWLLLRSVAERMREARSPGALVVVSSNAGTTPRVKMGGYCASKAALTMMMHCFALELAQFGIRCNAVSPGSTNTPMLRNLLGPEAVSASVAGDPSNYRLGIPLGKVAEPEDIAQACLFLLSASSRQITGHDLRVDGGATWS